MNLYDRFAALQIGDKVIFTSMPSKRTYKVVTNILEDVLYFYPVDEKDAGFHIFYDSILNNEDEFELV